MALSEKTTCAFCETSINKPAKFVETELCNDCYDKVMEVKRQVGKRYCDFCHQVLDYKKFEGTIFAGLVDGEGTRTVEPIDFCQNCFDKIMELKKT